MEKISTGIAGFDEVSFGGLPRGRITLIAGGAGCGKSLFLVTAIVRHIELTSNSAVFFSFEEQPEDIIYNATSIGLDLMGHIESGKLRIEFIKSPEEAVEEAGSYSLDGLLMRIELALARSDAKMVAIDTIETLFGMFGNQRTVRHELVRVFRWLRQRGVTAILSGERGDEGLTRHGLEEYVSDCVILIDQRVVGDVATRRLRLLKYRGSSHGTAEYPFVIDSQGLTIMPLSSAQLDHVALETNVSTGLDQLDVALSGGYRQGSTVLISGTSGSGKTQLGASFVAAACRRGERAFVASFEESPDEYVFNARSAGVDLEPDVVQERLFIHSARPTILGLEQHLVEIYRQVEQCRPQVAVIDPISSLSSAGTEAEVHRTLIRMIDHFKRKRITTVFTTERTSRKSLHSGLNVSSIIDTWLSLDLDRTKKRFVRRLSIIKKRGSGHSRGSLSFEITARGITFTETVDAG